MAWHHAILRIGEGRIVDPSPTIAPAYGEKTKEEMRSRLLDDGWFSSAWVDLEFNSGFVSILKRPISGYILIAYWFNDQGK